MRGIDLGEHGARDHALLRIPGDGREGVVAAPDLVKIRAEDGRYVEGVDISAFIGSLPGAGDTPSSRDPACFSSEDASGSTSQAANIVEALEVGAAGLLLDEDTSASNFMVRDARMQALVATSHEPITPFVERVRELFDVHGVSTILVMGGCGDYFEVAHRVIVLREYQPLEATAEARRIAESHGASRANEARSTFGAITPRMPQPGSFDPSRGRRDVKIDARGLDLISFGREDIVLRGVEQLNEEGKGIARRHARVSEQRSGFREHETPKAAALELSALDHGTAPVPIDELPDLANRTLGLEGPEVLLEGPSAPDLRDGDGGEMQRFLQAHWGKRVGG